MQRAGRSLSLAVVLLFVCIGVAQWGSFTQPVLTGADRIMDQYESFRAHVARDGHHDLVVFGTSVARQGVNVSQLQDRMARDRGRPVLAYNFGSGGNSVPTLLDSVELVYGVDDPPLALVVVTLRMASCWRDDLDEGLRLVLASPYGQALGDPIAWRGALSRWLLDHVAAFGLRHRLQGVLLGRPSLDRSPGGYEPRRGYQSWPPQDADHVERQRESDRGGDWSVSETKASQLAEVVHRLEAHGARVWLVEAPVHPDRAAELAELGVPPSVTARVIRQVASETGARTLLLPRDFELAPSEFTDLWHLRKNGATRYTAWLADALEADLEDARVELVPR